MRYVILRDDDTNALTPVDCLQQLYQPFLNCGLPINLAVIPCVRTDAATPDGRLEGFLMAKNGNEPETITIGSNRPLVDYLQSNAGYHILQHGFHHEYFEFDRIDRPRIVHRLDEGSRLLMEAGFPLPTTFVAPYDKLSRRSLQEAAKRFRVLSTGWFEWRRLPLSWWPEYAFKKISMRPHWQVGKTLLLTHPGCLLSHHRSYETMLEKIIQSIESRQLTVLVTHWWEYFPNQTPNHAFIRVLHQLAAYLSGRQDIRTVSFDDLARGSVPLN